MLPGSPVAEAPASEPRGPALSPSRAADFMTCPLLYRFRVIDRLPEPPTEATARDGDSAGPRGSLGASATGEPGNTSRTAAVSSTSEP